MRRNWLSFQRFVEKLIQTMSNPSLYVERRDCLAALRRSIQEIEAARAALVRAKQRLESENK
jgi:hypothetical protein